MRTTPRPPRLDLVIFDCDGVLVDSEPIAERVLASVLAERGTVLSLPELRRRFFGKTVAQCVEIIETLTGRAMADAQIADWRERLYTEFRTAPVQAVAGVAAAIHELRVVRQLPLCVVSNGPIAKMETTLGVTGLRQHFGATLYSPDLGLPGKPAPDLFLAAARAFGAEPEHCVVIDDSAGGIRGGRAAGMRTLGFTGLELTDADALAAAGAELFDDMRELPALLDRH